MIIIIIDLATSECPMKPNEGKSYWRIPCMQHFKLLLIKKIICLFFHPTFVITNISLIHNFYDITICEYLSCSTSPSSSLYEYNVGL